MERKQYVSGDVHEDRENDLLDRLIKTNVAVLNDETQQHDHSTALDLPCCKGQLKCDGTRTENHISHWRRNGRVHLTLNLLAPTTVGARINP